MAQTKRGSAVEVVTNLVTGFPINFCLNIAILPNTWDNDHKAKSAFITGVVFTVVSIIRQLVIRRWFNSFKAAWANRNKETA